MTSAVSLRRVSKVLAAFVLGVTLVGIAPRAFGQDAEITAPVWIARAPLAELPRQFSGAFPLNVSLRCIVRAGALADCAASRQIPDAFLTNAIAAASQARIATEDAQGVATEGRPIVVQIGFPIPVAVEPPAAPPDQTPMENLIWLEQPDARDFARLYPMRAQQENVSGSATLHCIVNGDGRLSCRIVSEEPAGYGFGEATLRIAREFRLAETNRDGEATAGRQIRRTIRWRIS